MSLETKAGKERTFPPANVLLDLVASCAVRKEDSSSDLCVCLIYFIYFSRENHKDWYHDTEESRFVPHLGSVGSWLGNNLFGSGRREKRKGLQISSCMYCLKCSTV